jgi:ABC-2 type transport system permease protein
MNTQSNAVPESFDARRTAPAALPEPRPLYWSVRRELWENRSIYIAPLAAAGVFLFGFLISAIHLPAKIRAAAALDPMLQQELMEQPYMFAALLIMGTAFIVAVFYCLDALHGERRDRSILFWKSLPVSDLTTVLSKASIPLVVLPLLCFAITIALQWIMLLVSSAVLLGSGESPAMLWTHMPWFQMSLMLLYHLVGLHGLWYAPIYCWLLLVSAWARRATFLWATLPPLAIGVIEKIAFNTSYFGAMLGHRFGGGAADTGSKATGMTAMSMSMLGQPSPATLLTSPGLWIGLAFAAAFLAGAVRMRRYQGPI